MKSTYTSPDYFILQRFPLRWSWLVRSTAAAMLSVMQEVRGGRWDGIASLPVPRLRGGGAANASVCVESSRCLDLRRVPVRYPVKRANA